MIVWLNGAYGVGKSALADRLHELKPNSFVFDAEEVGNAVRENMPPELFCGYIFESYPMWHKMCAALLTDIGSRYAGDIYVPMTLVMKDSFDRIRRPIEESGLTVYHVLLESTYEIIHDRILQRGESENCWCMQQIDLCLTAQKEFEDVIRIKSTGKSVSELANEVFRAVGRG